MRFTSQSSSQYASFHVFFLVTPKFKDTSFCIGLVCFHIAFFEVYCVPYLFAVQCLLCHVRPAWGICPIPPNHMMSPWRWISGGGSNPVCTWHHNLCGQLLVSPRTMDGTNVLLFGKPMNILTPVSLLPDKLIFSKLAQMDKSKFW